MYCRKCGKQIDYDAPLCKECEQAEQDFGGQMEDAQTADTPTRDEQYPMAAPAVQEDSAPAQEQPKGSRKEGLGASIASAVLGVSSFVMNVIALLFADLQMIISPSLHQGHPYPVIDPFAIFFLIAGVATMIPAIILGVKSMLCFFKAKREGRLKPIATLICGISGIVMSGISILYAFLTLLMLYLF